jgi:hypothetical protein
MKKKFPGQITIFGRKVKIKQGLNLVYNGQPCLGLCDYIERVIYIEKDQPDRLKYETLCHEATHFFLEITGLSQKISESENEIYCQLITQFFYDMKKEL